MAMDFTVRGLADLDKELSKMSARAEHKTLVAAGRAGAAVVRRKLKKTLPRGPERPFYVRGRKFRRKHLHKLMGVHGVRRGRTTSGEVWLGYRGQGNRYGHIVEFGNSTQAGGHEWEQAFASTRAQVLAAVVKKLQAEIIKRARAGTDQL